MLLQQGRQGQQQPGHLSKHCSKIKQIIAIARQGQEIVMKWLKRLPGPDQFACLYVNSCHIRNANPHANVRSRFIHVKQKETPSFWEPLQQLLPQTDFFDITGPIVQIENIGVRMMGGNLIIVFTVPFKPLETINTPSPWKILSVYS